MKHNILSPANFPFSFSEIVATAAMALPPLTRPQDGAFISKMTEVVIDMFWQNYVADLPEETRKELRDAEDADTGVPLYEWFCKRANFEEDALAEVRGRSILMELMEKLPTVFQKEYSDFTEDDAVAL